MGAKHTPGPCAWNGNEIVLESEPNKGIAGLAQDSPEEWGPLFAAAPDMLEALKDCLLFMENDMPSIASSAPERRKAQAAIAKATGEKE